MSIPMPQLQVGAPLTWNALHVFPLYADAGACGDYQLADEAMGAATVAVQEISEGGSVPELLVENTGDRRVLFLEGEELRGAKQNRILNASLLVPAHAKLKVPVSCVEQGRWRHTSKHFASSKTRSPHGLHYSLKASVSDSLKRRKGHRSDQGAVWNEVSKMQAAFGHASPTTAMSDTYDNLADQMTAYREHLRYPAGAIGLAIAVGSRLVGLDVFDQPGTCEKAWDRVLSGSIIDALDAAAGEAHRESVESLVQQSQSVAWDEAPAVGDGQEYRAEFNGCIGSALMLGSALVHLNVLSPPA